MQARQMPNPMPADVKSPRGKLVYLYLDTVGEATLDDLEDGLNLPRLTLYGVLKTLRERGLVDQKDDCYVTASRQA